MKSFIVASTLAAIAMIPSCPAPPAFIPGIIAGAIGSVGAGIAEVAINAPGKKARGLMRHERRQITLPPGVPQFNLDLCYQSMTGITISVTDKGGNSFQIDNVPAPCMNLATLLTGEGATVFPCGSACLSYENLSDADAGLLWGAIDQLKNAGSQ